MKTRSCGAQEHLLDGFCIYCWRARARKREKKEHNRLAMRDNMRKQIRRAINQRDEVCEHVRKLHRLVVTKGLGGFSEVVDAGRAIKKGDSE